MTEATETDPFPGLSWQDITNAVAMCATAQWDPLNHPEWKATLDRLVAVSDAGPDGHGQASQPEPEAGPPLPPGDYGRFEMPGYREHVGWVSDGMRAGAGVLVIRRRDGQVIAEVVPGPNSRFVHLPVPVASVEAEPELAALPAGAPPDWYGEDDGEPTGTFAGRVDPEAAF